MAIPETRVASLEPKRRRKRGVSLLITFPNRTSSTVRKTRTVRSDHPKLDQVHKGTNKKRNKNREIEFDMNPAKQKSPVTIRFGSESKISATLYGLKNDARRSVGRRELWLLGGCSNHDVPLAAQFSELGLFNRSELGATKCLKITESFEDTIALVLWLALDI